MKETNKPFETVYRIEFVKDLSRKSVYEEVKWFCLLI
jgi:hypothetical protein